MVSTATHIPGHQEILHHWATLLAQPQHQAATCALAHRTMGSAAPTALRLTAGTPHTATVTIHAMEFMGQVSSANPAKSRGAGASSSTPGQTHPCPGQGTTPTTQVQPQGKAKIQHHIMAVAPQHRHPPEVMVHAPRWAGWASRPWAATATRLKIKNKNQKGNISPSPANSRPNTTCGNCEETSGSPRHTSLAHSCGSPNNLRRAIRPDRPR